jgi:diguanylate cyclase (GGDEF)-like protein
VRTEGREPVEGAAHGGGSGCAACPARTAADPLTGLADRRLFGERLAAAFAEPPDAPSAGPAVLLIDLDRFKAVNDTLGHPAGDALLRAAAGRLRSALRADGGCVAARLGGDEFAVLLPAVPDRAAVEILAARLLDLLSRPYIVQGRAAVVGASIGAALAPENGTAPDCLLSRADLALYTSKNGGRGRFSFFEPAMQARAEARRQLEQDLRAALPLDEFELHYQPQLDLAERRLSGFEALLRWRHPERGLVPPDAFIPLAEEIGLISAIGGWVLRAACEEAARWPENLCVAVNIAAPQLETGRLVGTVEGALAASGLSGRRLELELTESALLRHGDATLDQLRALKRLGVQVSLDDFGTGYSSLTQLRSFPFDRVKIDRSFVDDAAVVRAVAALGASLGMRTTAEGVETPAQLRRLHEAGCTEAQGYLLGRPVPGAALPELIGRFVAGTATMIEEVAC